MSTGEEAKAQAQAAEVVVKEGTLLDQAIKATKQTEKSRAEELLEAPVPADGEGGGVGVGDAPVLHQHHGVRGGVEQLAEAAV